MRQALDTGAAIAVLLQGPQQMVGDGPHVPVRAAGRDNQAVGHGGLALEINEDDVLGLVVIQAVQDKRLQRGNTLREGGAGRRGRCGLRGLRRVGAQRNNSCSVTPGATSTTRRGPGQPRRDRAARMRSRRAVEDWKLSGP
mgnify:CR=1 FL=1